MGPAVRRSRRKVNVAHDTSELGDAPPSTLAAQIVEGLSTGNGDADETHVNFDRLLQEILESEQSTSSESIVETDIKVNHKLLVVCVQAGLAKSPNDPFAPNGQAHDRILKTLSVVQLVIQKTPEVLFLRYDDLPEGQGPIHCALLYIWLIPKLLQFMTPRYGPSIPQRSMEVLQQMGYNIDRSMGDCHHLAKFSAYLRSCVQSILDSLGRSFNISDDDFLEFQTPAVSVPLPWAGSDERCTESCKNCHTSVKDISHAILITISVIFSTIVPPKSVESVPYGSFFNKTYQSWTFDRLDDVWRHLMRNRVTLSRRGHFTILLSNYLLTLQQICCKMLKDSPSCRSQCRAIRTFNYMFKDVAKPVPGSLDSEAQKLLCLILINALAITRLSLQAGRTAERLLLPTVLQLNSDVNVVEQFTKDFCVCQIHIVYVVTNKGKIIVDLWLKIFENSQLPSTSPPADFDDAIIDQLSAPEIKVGFREYLAKFPDYYRLEPDHHPSKRLKLSADSSSIPNDNLYDKIVLEITSLVKSRLGDNTVASDIISVDAFVQMSESEQSRILTNLGDLACAKAGTLRQNLSSDDSKRLCSYCSQSLSNVRSDTWLGTENEGSFSILYNITQHQDIQRLAKPRVCAVLSLRSLVAHTKVPAQLDLSRSSLGQWCLQCLRSSHRELRIAAGRAIPMFLREQIDEDILRANQLLVLDFIRVLTETKELSLQETCILTWGQIAQLSRDEQLNIALLRLVEYLGHPNPLLYGAAINELLRLSSSSTFQLRQLLQPFWRSLAVCVVKDLHNRPQIAQQLSELLGLSVTEFLVYTQIHTLPYLVLYRKVDIVQRIAQACGNGTTTWSLCMEHTNMAAILALLLIQPSTDLETTTMLLLREQNTKFNQFDLVDLVKGEPIEILCELLKAAGEADESKKSRVHQAIYFLANLCNRRSSSRTEHKKSVVLGSFFELHSLGVMAQFSNIINDIRDTQSTMEKRRCLLAIEEMVKLATTHISNCIPQICTLLESALNRKELRDQAFSAWITMIKYQQEDDLSTLLEATFSIIVQNWENFRPSTHELAHNVLRDLIKNHESLVLDNVENLPSLDSIPMLSKLDSDLSRLKTNNDLRRQYQAFHRRCQHENATVVVQTLREFLPFLRSHQEFLQETAISEQPDPLVGQLTRTLLDVGIKFNESRPDISSLSCQCLGIIGCLDSNRVEVIRDKSNTLVLSNFEKADETIEFLLQFVQDILVKTFLSANPKSQGFLAYAMQELLRFCDLKPIVTFRLRDAQGNANYRRWVALPEAVRNILTPFLTSKYVVTALPIEPHCSYPIYSPDISHGTWLRMFIMDLLQKGSGDNVRMIFPVLSRIIKGQDILIANFLLPYVALNVILGGSEKSINEVAQELLEVLQRQPTNYAHAQRENLKLCCESVFSVLDYLLRWMQEKKKQAASSRDVITRGTSITETEEPIEDSQVSTVEHVLSSIPADIIATRAVECKSYARALFHWEQHIRQTKAPRTKTITDLEPLYEKLQEIYQQIDEPDGIEGISAHLHILNVEQQILEHRKAGRWTAAQSWYELLLAEKPNDVDVQVNLLTCLRESGQHDVLLNQIEGLSRGKSVSLALLPFAVEASWVTGKWNLLEQFLSNSVNAIGDDFNIDIGRALLALHQKNFDNFLRTTEEVRMNISKNLSITSTSSIQASHDTLLKLHVLYEVEEISAANVSAVGDRQSILRGFDRRLQVLGAFPMDKQYLLGLRRATMQLSRLEFTTNDIASAWLTSARLARKANFTHQAFNAVLHASQLGDESATIEHSRLLWKEGHHRKAIQSLEGAIAAGAFRIQREDNVDTTGAGQDQQDNFVTARAYLLLAKWLDTAGQTQSLVAKKYQDATLAYSRWEKCHYYLGKHYNKILDSSRTLPPRKQPQQSVTGETSKLVIMNYLRALQFGTKYVFQTLPKVITLWLEMGTIVDRTIDSNYGTGEEFRTHIFRERKKQLEAIHANLKIKSEQLPAFVWYTAFSQLVARIVQTHKEVQTILNGIILKVVTHHPQQSLWTLLAVVKSSSTERAAKGAICLNRLKDISKKSRSDGSIELRTLITHSQKLSEQLLQVCEGELKGKPSTVSLTKDLGFQHKIAPSLLAVPIQATLTARLPIMHEGINIKRHKAFSKDTVTISAFLDDVLVLNSLQRPRKISIRGSDGRVYGLLCKPKDDLRKDQRLMEFNAMINRALKRNTETSQRQLYIKTYAVTPLNEECGIIEWIDNLKTLREILLKLYKRKNIPVNYTTIREMLNEASSDPDKLSVFTEQLIPSFPPIFHEWFLDMFSQPEVWFSARLRYTRSCAVMSIVGHVLGLGDRHGENILFEEGNGGTFHVDFNCLFDKGLTFEKPEKVPFRLTHNMVDAFGAYGYEGPFRKSCELTMGILRQNEDTLMTILESFLYDPTTDFIGKKKKTMLNVPETPQEVLDSVRSKVRGLLPEQSVPLSIEGHIDELIRQATDPTNLAAMYIGWCAFF